VTLEAVEALASFMREFQRTRGWFPPPFWGRFRAAGPTPS